MVTIFTTLKPCKDHSRVIQHNAIKSWALLRPTPQIILFGNEEGTAEVAAELKLTHVADVERSETGTPLVNSMFSLSHQLSSNPLLCYVNADIMLTSQFMEALRVVSAAKTQFVMTGRRTLLDVEKPWDFDQVEWEGALHNYAATKGRLDKWPAMDYFAFPRGVFTDLPPLVVGRARWDNWIIYSARRRGIPVVEATHDVLAIHQNHDYSHLAGGEKDCFISPDAQRNQELYGLQTCIGTLDATHLVKNGHLTRALGWVYLSRRLDTLAVFHPMLAPLAWPLLAARQLTKPLRRRLGWKPSSGVSSRNIGTVNNVGGTSIADPMVSGAPGAISHKEGTESA